MRILLLTRSFNSLSQRLYVELAARGHGLAVEFDISGCVTEEAVELFRPELIVAPFLQRAIPASVWRRHVCLIVHPGIVGDRGPSALDRAILRGEAEWGVTVLQAEAEMDAGPVWASRGFPMRQATKSSLYRNEVTEAATAAVLEAVERFAGGGFKPHRVSACDDGVRGRAWPLLRQDERRIDWSADDTATVLRKLAAADGAPGVLDELFGVRCHLFDGHRGGSRAAAPGRVVARDHDAIQRATVDGSVWIGHCKRLDGEADFKLPVGVAFAAEVAALAPSRGYPEIAYDDDGAIGVLHFPFCNGAMSTSQCRRLLAAWRAALERPTRVLVLAGGPDFFSNGLHLNVIEAARSPADESLANIEAMDDLCEAILTTTDRVTVAALQGNAGAGGCFLALTADRVVARDGVLLNPHYRNMGNLYGSEYWTWTLPRRVKDGDPGAVMRNRLPIGAHRAQALGLVDDVFDGDRTGFMARVSAYATRLARDEGWAARIEAKRAQRARDEAARPLAQYRAEELAQLRRNFHGFDSSYHVARSYFVRKTPHSWTPRHLAVHRDTAARRPASG